MVKQFGAQILCNKPPSTALVIRHRQTGHVQIFIILVCIKCWEEPPQCIKKKTMPESS